MEHQNSKNYSQRADTIYFYNEDLEKVYKILGVVENKLSKSGSKVYITTIEGLCYSAKPKEVYYENPTNLEPVVIGTENQNLIEDYVNI